MGMDAPAPSDEWFGRRIAITGATGFVGHHLSSRLVHAGAEVTALVRATSATDRLKALGCRCLVAPLDDPAALTRALGGCEIVFHVAASVDFGNDMDRLRAINVGGTANLLAAARAAGVRRVVHTSSVVAVGCSDRPVPLDEESPWNLGALRNPYITTKREAEELALATTGVEVVVANPGCIIGPDDFSRSEFGTLCRRFWRGRVPVSFPGGNGFVDVRDVADGLIRVAARGRAGQRYLLSGHNLTFAEFFRALAGAAGRRYPRLPLPRWSAPLLAGLLRLAPAKPGTRPLLSPETARLMGRYFFFDTTKARTELGWQARPLAETLSAAHAFWMPTRAA
jgi:dihydroflavonol-4-reductase